MAAIPRRHKKANKDKPGKESNMEFLSLTFLLKAPGGSLGGQAIFEVDLSSCVWHGKYEEEVEYGSTVASKHTTLANAQQLSFGTWQRGIKSTEMLFQIVPIKSTWVNNGRIVVKEWP